MFKMARSFQLMSLKILEFAKLFFKWYKKPVASESECTMTIDIFHSLNFSKLNCEKKTFGSKTTGESEPP